MLRAFSVGPQSRTLFRWQEILETPKWPVALRREIRRYVLRNPRSAGLRAYRWAMYDLVARLLEERTIILGSQDSEVDRERETITQIVVHHSHSLPDISSERISAMGLLRLYVPAFWQRHTEQDASMPSSGHWRGEKQVFYPYHWCIRRNGAAQRLLYDEEIGWHAGNWAVNCRSIAICLAGDYSTQSPSHAVLETLAVLCASYPNVDVRPHSHFNPFTSCPGAWARHYNLCSSKTTYTAFAKID